MTKWVYGFGGGRADGHGGDEGAARRQGRQPGRDEQSGPAGAAGLHHHDRGLHLFYAHGRTYPDELERAGRRGAGRGRAGARHAASAIRSSPLLVSVRSGAPVSMPGMMDTVLNLGLNDQTVEGLAAASGDARFAYDSYRRFIQMYGDVVLGRRPLPVRGGARGRQAGAAACRYDTELDADALAELVAAYKKIVAAGDRQAVPAGSRGAALGRHRRRVRLLENAARDHLSPAAQHPDDMGTAVTVQAMVFGNMGDDCATGVAFTRNPSTGERAFYGEFLINAQGEDVVAGIRTPQPLTRAMAAGSGSDGAADGGGAAGGVRRARATVFERLERHYRDMQDIEFTIAARQALHPADPQPASARPRPRSKIAVDMAARGADHRRRRRCCGSTRPRSTSFCTRRSTPRPSAR